MRTPSCCWFGTGRGVSLLRTSCNEGLLPVHHIIHILRAFFKSPQPFYRSPNFRCAYTLTHYPPQRYPKDYTFAA